jgi:hypothetical protein
VEPEGRLRVPAATADTTGAADMIRQPRSGGSIEGPATRMRPPRVGPFLIQGTTLEKGRRRFYLLLGERGMQCL